MVFILKAMCINALSNKKTKTNKVIVFISHFCNMQSFVVTSVTRHDDSVKLLRTINTLKG